MTTAMLALFLIGAALLAIAPRYQHDAACAPEVVVACAYCGHRADAGAFPAAPVSHGICPDCYRRELAALHARQGADLDTQEPSDE
jgi:hypothetical protein